MNEAIAALARQCFLGEATTCRQGDSDPPAANRLIVVAQ
jgi:hypothetical protein